MKKRVVSVLLSFEMATVLLAGCGQSSGTASSEAAAEVSSAAEEGQTSSDTEADEEDSAETDSSSEEDEEDSAAESSTAETDEAGSSDSSELEDGEYSADFKTDNKMFSVNEANDGKGLLTVQDGKMTIHVSLNSENIVNLFAGTSEDAQKDGAELINPSVDEVTYSDGTSEEVYGFDIPVPALDEEFDVAIIGTKGKWYDHKVTVSDAEPISDEDAAKLADIVEPASGTAAAESSSADSTETAEASSDDDQAAADKVAALIDAIYVQTRNDNTDEQCKEAKEAWDALTDAQRALVSGENADPDYFGRDTGDAALDDPLNGDDIGENELLVVSFGTSFNNSRAKDISSIERALQEAYPDWSVRRAFTAQIIINHVEARNGEYIDNMDQALQRAVDNGVKNLVVQPTHLMHGAEYDELNEAVDEYKDQFDSVKVAEPLLGEVGKSTSEVNSDKETVAKAITSTAVDEAGYKSLDEAEKDGTAFVFMGHGTSHEANITYDQMQSQMEDLGYDNVFIGTVEGKPADTACEAVIDKVHDAGYKKVVLRPLMVVAGDHANNDMAGDDDDSWKSQFNASGYFDQVDCQIEGLGEIPEIEDIYIDHTSAAIGQEPAAYKAKTASGSNAAKTDAKADQAAADKVAGLIDDIYVQTRNDKTDEQCKEAKDAWDALTDAQRELVSGENADPDYFGRDTGDASLDNPLNGDDIGKNELLVVSFGTSFNNSRSTDISGIERALQEAYPDWSVRRAFTAQIIINHVEARDGEYIDNMDQALQRAVDSGVENLVVQPTHLMHGAEYDELNEAVDNYKDQFKSVTVAEPLLGEVGKSTSEVNSDKETVAKAITATAVSEAGYDSLDDAAKDGTAFVFMGHGTSHTANITYDQMQSQMEDLGYDNVFIGTVEGKPADTACEAVIKKVHDAGYKKVILRPLMVVAGDHANNDMAGDDDDSWKSQFNASGYFDEVDCQIEGLGRIPEIEDIYISHTSDAIGEEPAAWKAKDETSSATDADTETAVSEDKNAEAGSEDAAAADTSDTEKAADSSSEDTSAAASTGASTSIADLADGRYYMQVSLEGGSGKAWVQSPVQVTVKDGKAEAIIVWSSSHYDYMIVDGQRYENESAGGNSSFTIPVDAIGTPIDVTADTTAMSQPHEIEYKLTFSLDD